ncbi:MULTISPECIES: transglutaminase-like cysteine peptidase [unclassified Mesorhizobium]|uniref:transglutaminase-like cysteine peptidase n=1 Tax=unclassified Mesorhizobium TaxID=325217 RepID=UPI00112A2E56|nr:MULTISPECIES: transglutaminase-like cysteine peptidase [unclassified Mesorhizobium]MBZ9933993.1 transglutaminase-like cysteine peptidase [Mesorhizobium sp. BR1-1-5]MBZ9683769.1 transglutaminase-like cysteine peptidase [Mesorhizobium sp. CO1-1-2]MBZ9694130.1 transglutaminase-like cysteine peptidase [Mesorhizobium sp. CO1-1-9]MBZ9727635.1 transglutaminase-like cysteine peptidase [Mesorhizobium sp. CO1-1-11]MBZ9904634.1 transglutaminase-like cysteine peptidase [Mesorhizobium sp. BR115XR7A]
MKKTRGKLLLMAMAMQLSAWGSAYAAGPAYMHTGGRTTQPVGHYEFCQRIPGECNEKTAKGAPVDLSRKLWATIVSINNSVNTRIKPRTDMENYGAEEYWAYPDNGYGDCEDYALEKRRELMDAGVPAGDLLMTVARQPNGDGHAVLTVRTSLGEFILDNLETKVLSWTDTDYTYLKRQSTENSGVWVTINDGRSDAVASVR